MLTLSLNLGLPLADELFADLVEHRQHHLVEEVMALDIKIGGVGCHPEAREVGLELLIALTGVGVDALQLRALLAYLAAYNLDVAVGVVERERTGLDDAQEVGHRELVVAVGAVVPDVPDEERIDGLGQLLEVLLHVEDDVVVERHRHTHVVERGRVALHVLDGVGVGVEDERTLEDGARGERGALDEVVVVGVDTGDEPLSGLAVEGAHQGSFLTPLQDVLPRGQHHLEVIVGRLKLTEDGAPEEHVVVALHISDDLLTLLFGVEAVGGIKIGRRQVVS